MNNLIFYGELPGEVNHGISISNAINLELLSEEYNIIKIEEIVLFSKGPVNYLFHRIISIILIFFKIVNCKIKNKNASKFYAVLPTSNLGAIKTLLLVFLVRFFYWKIEVILHVHRGDFISFRNSSNLSFILIKLIFLWTDKIICLSSDLRVYIESNFSKQAFSLENCLSKEIPFCDAQKYDNRLRILYFSNITQEKGIFTLLEAIKNISDSKNNLDVEMSVFGSFANEKVKNEYEIVTRPLKYIKYKGVINGDEKYNIYKEHDVFILPSFNEGQPISIIEAMSVGTPIISTDVGYVKDMFWSEYPYIFDAGDVKKLENLVLNLSRLKASERSSLSQRLHFHFLEKFSKEKHKQNLLKIFSC
ncbi:glycosyltransferase family 4 protein [Vibrio vulnificus]|nr:glycosyltransferase family 4 protein [Vibrio vulnificus]EIA1321675.1 glycosyltransferase family 4 protein [Vibrio vulnificus]EIV8606704.1 glycosyltransferase family 4 protein [Vibrio vulnificus]ELR8674736.1 glycosyltransferase family 4 protein [Vibrio vulnificus]ELR8760137.1 glycosyltransferase family 4 protein [Vibrio vulnificus]